MPNCSDKLPAHENVQEISWATKWDSKLLKYPWMKTHTQKQPSCVMVSIAPQWVDLKSYTTAAFLCVRP